MAAVTPMARSREARRRQGAGSMIFIGFHSLRERESRGGFGRARVPPRGYSREPEETGHGMAGKRDSLETARIRSHAGGSMAPPPQPPPEETVGLSDEEIAPLVLQGGAAAATPLFDRPL